MIPRHLVIGMGVMLVVAAARHTRTLYDAERIE